jgi:hypothetical protein
MWRATYIQLLLRSSIATVLFLNRAFLNRFGAMLIGVIPSIHLSCQNMAFSPFPSSILVDAQNSARSSSSQGVTCPIHGLSSSVQRYQHHLRCRAFLKRFRSCIPRPPSSFGLHTMSHLTRQRPPCFHPHLHLSRRSFAYVCQPSLLAISEAGKLLHDT